MVEPPSGARGYGGFGVEGDPDPGGRQHRQIIGAVPDSHRMLQWNGVFGGQGEQRFPFLLSPVTIGGGTVPAMRPAVRSSRLATT